MVINTGVITWLPKPAQTEDFSPSEQFHHSHQAGTAQPSNWSHPTPAPQEETKKSLEDVCVSFSQENISMSSMEPFGGVGFITHSSTRLQGMLSTSLAWLFPDLYNQYIVGCLKNLSTFLPTHSYPCFLIRICKPHFKNYSSHHIQPELVLFTNRAKKWYKLCSRKPFGILTGIGKNQFQSSGF